MSTQRFKVLTAAEMTAEQKALADAIVAGPRGALHGPFNSYLRSPEIGNHLQQLGAAVRFNSSLPKGLAELAICQVARQWGAAYEWAAHRRQAIENGIAETIVDAIAHGKRPSGMKPEEEEIYDFTRDLIEDHEVTDAHHKAIVDRFGERGVMDLIATIGYFTVVAMVLNAERYPAPAGAPALPTLK
jgi:4-carboxymuconolactone decarboxylase